MTCKVFASGGEMDEQEKKAYIDRAIEKFGHEPKEIHAYIDGEYVELSYIFRDQPPFQRIRRITGYLVGDMSHWNNGKRAEEHDRVKHTV